MSKAANFKMSLRSDPFGRLDKIPKPRRQLQPLFEAISNSLFSVRRHNPAAPQIRVLIDRDEKQKRMPDSPPSTSIVRFTVEDNGEGFTNVNCDSFCNTDSRHKKQVGGKGIGRLLWLKTFKHVEIASVFAAEGGFQKRSFHFRQPSSGTNFFSSLAEVPCAADTPRVTTVALVSPVNVIRRTTDEVAYEIIEHFLTAFTSRPAVNFKVVDNVTKEEIDLNQLFRDEINVEEKQATFETGEHEFTVRHCLMSSKAATRHSIYLCAEGLPVVQLQAERPLKIPHAAIAQDDGKTVYYSGYVTAKLLDERNNPERQNFDLPTKDQVVLTNEPTVEAIQHAVAKEARQFLSPHLKDFKKKNLARVRQYIADHPGYRHLLTQERGSLEMMPAGTTDKELDLLLYKVDKRNEVRERTRAAKLLATIHRRSSDVDADRLLKQVNRLLSDVNEASRSRLAEYVIRRRVTLQFLRDIIGPAGDSPISLEDAVHNLIFPMRTTSDQVRMDETNLWLIDERFAYHRFLSSDKVAFKSATAIKSGGDGTRAKQVRHDLLVGFSRDDVFDHALASSSDSLSVDALAIIEFKKPQRDDYTSAENPIQQTTEYARDIREEKIYNYRKQKIEIPAQQPIFCYMICDLTPTLKTIASDRGFDPLPGGDGLFFVNKPLNMFQTIISYRKLLMDAQKRNDALFDRLHIRSELGSLESVAAEAAIRIADTGETAE